MNFCFLNLKKFEKFLKKFKDVCVCLFFSKKFARDSTLFLQGGILRIFPTSKSFLHLKTSYISLLDCKEKILFIAYMILYSLSTSISLQLIFSYIFLYYILYYIAFNYIYILYIIHIRARDFFIYIIYTSHGYKLFWSIGP